MHLSHADVFMLLLSLGILLALARILGELAAVFKQPTVLGELAAGLLLGPTVLGAVAPNAVATLFPVEGPVAVGRDAVATLAITLFLLVAGMEVNLSAVWRQGRTALSVGATGIACPFAVGFLLAWLAPTLLGGRHGVAPHVFALFFATALSISALPVIAKTLMDLNLYRSDLGMVIVAAAILNDVVGWIIFAVVLAMMGAADHGPPLALTVVFTAAFVAAMLTAGRWGVHRLLPLLHAHASSPAGVLGFAATLALLFGALTQWIGTHAIFGAFLFGVALGDSPHLRQHTRRMIHHFVAAFLAPIFFASIGLTVNFRAHFDLTLVLVVLVIACLGKVAGCGAGARLAGMSRREACAVGFGMNARGAMEIVLGLLALQAGLIREPMFVALVVMAWLTSMMSGPVMQRVLRLKRPRRLTDVLPARAYAGWLKTADRREAIGELSRAVALAASVSAETVRDAVWSREQAMSTGVGNGVAVPHARLDGLARPVVGVGLSGAGIDFDAPDGQPAHLIFLILTPTSDDGAQLEILAEIARVFSDPEVRQNALRAANHTELLAIIKSAAA